MKPELLVLAGPTASGKSALALRLAERLEGEVVSADSQQVYRHFDIGTAKPSAEELARVPHHLVSVVDPHEVFSAARFGALADEAIAAIRARGRRVIVAGGTGLYLRVLLHGVMPAPSADPALRRRLTDEARAHGVATLHERLRRIDPQTAAKVSPRDPVRIIRALEIHELTGEAPSTHQQAHGFTEDRYDFRLFVLDPPREALYAAIDARTQAMFERGLVREVERLVADGFREAAVMRSVGYAEALAVLDGAMSAADAIRRTAQRTRQYAKRQVTWFRKERGARFVQPPFLDEQFL